MVTHARDDSGVTLVELLVAMTITALLSVVIAAAFNVGVTTTDAANTRLAGSQGAQITTSFFPADVQSSSSITRGSTPCTGTPATIAVISWTDADLATPAGVARSATYTCVPSGSTRNLVRQYSGGGTAVLAYDVTAAAVACRPATDCLAPTSATITVTESGGFTFSVTGSRRLP